MLKGLKNVEDKADNQLDLIKNQKDKQPDLTLKTKDTMFIGHSSERMSKLIMSKFIGDGDASGDVKGAEYIIFRPIFSPDTDSTDDIDTANMPPLETEEAEKKQKKTRIKNNDTKTSDHKIAHSISPKESSQ